MQVKVYNKGSEELILDEATGDEDVGFYKICFKKFSDKNETKISINRFADVIYVENDKIDSIIYVEPEHNDFFETIFHEDDKHLIIIFLFTYYSAEEATVTRGVSEDGKMVTYDIIDNDEYDRANEARIQQELAEINEQPPYDWL